jgi:hypothetical protein
MTAKDWFGVIEHALWPAVVLVLTLALRKPIGSSLAALAGRVNKVSIMSVSIELAVARAADPPWRGVGGDDVRGLVVADRVNDSYFDTLRQTLHSPGLADYMIVDLRGDGDEWLSSRLYLFTYVLSRLKKVRALVFVGTRGDVARSFLGVAAVDDVMRALASSQPWLREARVEAEAEQIGYLPTPLPLLDPTLDARPTAVPLDVDDWWAAIRDGTAYHQPLELAQKFVKRLQWAQPSNQADPTIGWLRLPDNPGQPTTWEHATWLRSSDLTNGLLRDVVQPDCYVIDDRKWTAQERIHAIAATRGVFVALLSPSRRFERLIDRTSLLAALGENAALPPKE